MDRPDRRPAVNASGTVAEWSCSGLQIRVRRFDSDQASIASNKARPPAHGLFVVRRALKPRCGVVQRQRRQRLTMRQKSAAVISAS